MKINITKKTKKLVILYAVVLVLLYLVIYILPKVTNIFETTQVLERGTLTISSEATGYLVKDESISLANHTGVIVHPVEEGTVVKKGTVLSSIEATGKKASVGKKYQDALEELSGFEYLKAGNEAQNSGVYSLNMDGHEKYFRIDNLDKIDKDTVEEFSYKSIDLNRNKVRKGEPIFKVSSDDNWYIVCWMRKKSIQFFSENQEVQLELPGENVKAFVHQIKKDGSEYRVVFYLNAYYKNFSNTRTADMNVVVSNNTGLIVDNECLIKKNKVQGVYVVTKDGERVFKPIKIKASDGKQSVLYDGTYTNDKYELVQTVNVYDEVLRHPDSALEDDLKSEK